MDRHSNTKVIIGGASNTKGPWPTWAEFVDLRYNCHLINVGKKGMGNEAIITTTLHQASKYVSNDDAVLILIMLTGIDKWDWFVGNHEVASRLDREKHNLVKLDPNARKGFWSTGSHFPLDKEYYRQHYYDQDYFAFKNMQMINMFKQVCSINDWKYHIFYDSPIWSMTETEINQRMPIDSDSFKLVENDLCKWLFDSSEICKDIYYPGLIGYLSSNNMPYHSNKYGPHPGPVAHLAFSKSHVFPVVDRHLSIKDNMDEIEEYARKMDNLWT